MATYTENYEMALPERADAFDVQDYNENFETIDTLMAENEAVVNEVNEKLGTPDEGETVFSLLKNSGNSVIKSIQRFTCVPEKDSETTIIEITPVDTSKSFVIVDKIIYSDTDACIFEYELQTSRIVMTHASFSYASLKVAFWVIEFN